MALKTKSHAAQMIGDVTALVVGFGQKAQNAFDYVTGLTDRRNIVKKHLALIENLERTLDEIDADTLDPRKAGLAYEAITDACFNIRYSDWNTRNTNKHTLRDKGLRKKLGAVTKKTLQNTEDYGVYDLMDFDNIVALAPEETALLWREYPVPFGSLDETDIAHVDEQTPDHLAQKEVLSEDGMIYFAGNIGRDTRYPMGGVPGGIKNPRAEELLYIVEEEMLQATRVAVEEYLKDNVKELGEKRVGQMRVFMDNAEKILVSPEAEARRVAYIQGYENKAKKINPLA